MVYGVTGSGKTTLASQISESTGIPWHSVDDLTWLPNWVPVEAEELRRRFAEICSADEWVLDTAYAKWLDIPMARVELIVALDYPRWFSLGRLIRRCILRARDRKPICNGNVEARGNLFSRESIVLWHFRSFNRKRARIRGWASEPQSFQIVVLRNQRETDAWLKTL